METNEKNKITVQASINATLEKVWNCWTTPENIVAWNFASDDWCCPRAENNLSVGGAFSYRMEAKDGGVGFDFGGIYSNIVTFENIEYILNDGRKAQNVFTDLQNSVEVKVTFEAESVNSVDLQKAGWQLILNNFKKHVEQ